MSVKRKLIEFLGETIVFLMPKRYLANEETAKEYMLSGDEAFDFSNSEQFSCGFSKSILTPGDVKENKYFIAGYNSNNKAVDVLDDMFARAIYIDDNKGNGGIILCSVDAVGMSRKDINDIRKLVLDSKEIGKLKSINICCTHSHSAIDTQGLWGEKIYKSGKNEEFMKRLKEKTATAIIEAYKNRTEGKLYFSKIETEDLQYDCRTPETYDKNLNRIHFIPNDKTKKEIFVINFASHAELLGSRTKNVSADFPCYMIKEIEENHKNCEVVYLNGAIGGMISAKEIKKVYRHEIDCEEYTKDFGKTLGKLVLNLTDEEEITPVINIKSKQINVPAENFVLILARLLKVLNNDFIKNKTKAFVISETGYLVLGNKQIAMFLIPGELFPELYNGEFLNTETSANKKNASYTPLIKMTD
ncbi:MAG: hypothetical protein IKT89_07615, partial [Clostridia bacterium]|nr:hypothetical protein [Clostridia bacterium]